MFSYCQNNPVMRTDSTGMWFGLDDIFTGPVDEIIVLGAIAYGGLWLASELGIPGASDARDTVGGWVDSGVQKIKNTVEEIKNKAKSTMFILAFAVYAELKDKTSPGTYIISFESDKHYIGKGPRYRMYISAIERSIKHKTLPTGFGWFRANNNREAYKNEYMLMVDYGYSSNPKLNSGLLYNEIWSKGRSYYYQDNGEYYPGDLG